MGRGHDHVTIILFWDSLPKFELGEAKHLRFRMFTIFTTTPTWSGVSDRGQMFQFFQDGVFKF